MATKVNVPVDPKVKERDVNNKLQLYGIYSGMFTLRLSIESQSFGRVAC